MMALSVGLLIMGISGVVPDKLPIVSTTIADPGRFLLCYVLIVFALDAAFLFYSYQDYLRYHMSLPQELEIPETYVDTRADLKRGITEISIRMESLRGEYETLFDGEIGKQSGILTNLLEDRAAGRAKPAAEQQKLTLLEEYFQIKKQQEV